MRSARCCIPTPGSIRAASRTGGVYEGREACGRFFERWFGTWDEIRLTPERFIKDGDRVIVSLVGYPDRAEALEAVGLRE